MKEGCFATVGKRKEAIAQVRMAPGKGESSFRIDCEKATLEEVGNGIRVTESGAKEPKVLPLDSVPAPESVLLDGFAAYITKGVEPPFSGPENLKTIALVAAVGKASDKDKVLNPMAM